MGFGVGVFGCWGLGPEVWGFLGFFGGSLNEHRSSMYFTLYSSLVTRTFVKFTRQILQTIGHVNNIPTMQNFTGISRNTRSKSYVLSLTECVWEFQNNALWDTHEHALFHEQLSSCKAAATTQATFYNELAQK